MEGAGTRSSLPFFSVADHDKAQAQYQRISRQTKAEKAASLEAYLRGVKEPFHLVIKTIILAPACFARTGPFYLLLPCWLCVFLLLVLPHLLVLTLWLDLAHSLTLASLVCFICLSLSLVLALCACFVSSFSCSCFIRWLSTPWLDLAHSLALASLVRLICLLLSLMLDLPFGRRYSMCSVRGDLFSVPEGDSDRGIHSSLTA